jgi:hypothetical protein
MAEVYAATFKGAFYGVQTFTRFYFERTTGSAGDRLLQLSDAILNFAIGGGSTFRVRWDNVVTIDWVWDYMTIQRVQQNPLLRVRTEVNMIGTGAFTGTALPPTTAVVMKRRTNLATRIAQGRIFIPAVALEATSGGSIPLVGITPQAYRAALTALATGMINSITGSDGAISNTFIGRVIQGGAFDLNGDPVVFPISIIGFDDVLRVQRRREVGVGV